ncbi:MAG: NAD(P)-dependent alcohol dehydrogenase [Candidatus Parvarchaeota archaeon]|nr:NAD(P)-dependent alcohol dehydrogenase [Candidatus Jingweiarchaeum tengchongense]
MKAFYLESIKQFSKKDISIPSPNAGEVLVKVKNVGICGSDVHYYEYGKIGNFVIEKPLILGHEAAGDVVAVGSEVKNLKVGDRVAMEPGIPCGKCKFCKSGRYNLCPDIKFWATPPVDGTFTEYVTHPADFCFKLPSDVSYEEGAMFEPLAVGLWATEKANLKPENSVAILGVGTIGMMTLKSVLAVGITDVTVFDVSDFKLDMAKQFGAKIVNSKDPSIFKNYSDAFDVVFETAGNSITTSNTVNLVSRGGTIILVGLPSKDENILNTNLLNSKEGVIKTVFRYANMYPRALQLVSSGKIQLKPLITKHFDFDQLPEAFDYIVKNNDKVIKVMMNF